MTSPTRRILLVTRNFPPLVGGMERLIHHVYIELKREFEVQVVGPRGCEQYIEPGDLAGCFSAAPPARFLLESLWRSLRAALDLKPQLVLAANGAVAPVAWLVARAAGARTLCLLHGSDITTENRLYRRTFLPFIRRCDLIIANSRYIADKAVERGVNPGKIHIIHPGTDLPVHRHPLEISVFRDKLGIGARPVLLTVGRLAPGKGLLEFTEHCLPRILERMPDAVWLLVGDDASEALLRGQPVADRLRRKLGALGLADSVRMLGRLSMDHPDLACAYACARVHVFPSVNPEGFGLVAVEAASHGLTTVAFALGGVPEAVSVGKSGDLVAPGDYPALARAVLDHLQQISDVSAERCRRHARRFQWTCYGEQLRLKVAMALRSV